MDISIIIPSFNTKKLLDQCLTSVFADIDETSLSVEVIVVDNNSSDGSKELLNKKYERVIKVFNNENLGYGKANNKAIEKAKGEWILLLNSDCIVQKGALGSLIACGRRHNKTFIGGKLLNEDMSSQASAGPFYSLPIVFMMLFLKGDTLNITRSSPDRGSEVDWVSGACLMGKKHDFEDVGLFDESIFMYMEEIDFLYRAKQKGYKTYFCPEAQIIHVGAASSGDKKAPVVNIFRGLSYFYKKHHPGMQYTILLGLLKLKAWLVILICGIIRNRPLQQLYEKALQTLG